MGSSFSRSEYDDDDYVYRQSADRNSNPRRFSYIGDEYDSIEQVTNALRNAGLESSNLIVGIDFTKSNEWTGKYSFNGRSLHSISDGMLNPYEYAISIIGRTLSPFDDDNLIPCFGFGDVTTHDRNVFSFFPDHRPCDGFEEALSRYREIVPEVRLAGPTSFAPIIEAAIDIVVKNDCQYHVLLIIADGQVTRSIDTDQGRLSPQEQSTIDALVMASEYPLSIVLVGVGDGPWDMMREFDDNIPERRFDNFQFVNFTEIMAKNLSSQQKEAAFALAALMEIPSQFRASVSLNLLNRRVERAQTVVPLTTPGTSNRAVRSLSRSYDSFSNNSFSSAHSSNSFSSAHSYESSNTDAQVLKGRSFSCPICWANVKNMAFNCGHQTCEDCGQNLTICPICRMHISSRLRLY